MARHDRSYTRYQRRRIISKRLKELQRERPDLFWDGINNGWIDSGRIGSLGKKSYFDCGHTRCGCCHFEKYESGRRAKDKRDWLRHEWLAQ